MSNLFQSGGASQGSFLPEDYIARKSEMRANFITLFLFGCVMLLVISAFFVTNRRWTTIRNEQLAINREYAAEAKRIEELEALEKERGKMMSKAEIITALDEKIPRAVLLAELNTRRPKAVAIEELDLLSKRIDPAKEAAALAAAQAASAPTKVKTLAPSGAKPGAKTPAAPEAKPEVKPPRFEASVKLTGFSSVYNDITDYAGALQRCPLLTDVELVYIKDAKVKDAEIFKFEISGKLHGSIDARGMKLDQAGAESGFGSRVTPRTVTSAGGDDHK